MQANSANWLPAFTLALQSAWLQLVLFSVFTSVVPCRAQAVAQPAHLSAEQIEWVRQHPQVEYALEADYGPFIYLDKNGVVNGLSVDILQLIGNKTGLLFKPGPPQNLATILKQAHAQQITMITSLRATPERSAFLNFSSPYASIPAILALPTTQPSLHLRDMKGKPIAVGQGYAVEHFVRDTYPEVNWHTVSDDLSALKAMQAGQVDGVVADQASLQFLSSFADTPTFQLASKVGYTYELSFAFSKSQTELAAIVQAGLQAISPLERDRILTKWMPPQQAVSLLDYRALIWIGLSLLLSIGFAWRFYRQTAIAKRDHT